MADWIIQSGRRAAAYLLEQTGERPCHLMSPHLIQPPSLQDTFQKGAAPGLQSLVQAFQAFPLRLGPSEYL
jgi:hypothetical protein